MVHLRRAGMRDLVLAGVAVVVLVVAVLLFFRSGPKDAPPADEYVGFYCPECDHSFRVSYRDFEKLWDNQEYKMVPERKVMLFRCSKCGQMTAERADKPPGSSPPEPPPAEQAEPGEGEGESGAEGR